MRSKVGTERATDISELTDDYEIALKFADYFAFSTSTSKYHSSLLAEYTTARTDYVGFPLTDSMLPNVELVDAIISDLKKMAKPRV